MEGLNRWAIWIFWRKCWRLDLVLTTVQSLADSGKSEHEAENVKVNLYLPCCDGNGGLRLFDSMHWVNDEDKILDTTWLPVLISTIDRSQTRSFNSSSAFQAGTNTLAE